MSYVILEWNQACRQPEVIDTDTYDERDDAVEHARTLLAANRANNRREGYSVHELDDMPEWQDEDDRVPAGTRRFTGPGELEKSGYTSTDETTGAEQ